MTLRFIPLIVFLLGFLACSPNSNNASRPPSSNSSDPFASPTATPVAKASQVPGVTNAGSPTPEPKKERWKASSQIPKKVAEIMEAAMELSDKGLKVPRPRGDDLTSIEKCAVLSKANLRAVEQLQRKADKLPNKYAIRLLATLIHLERCVSCYPNANMKCFTVKDTLREADRTFLEQ